MSSRPRKTIRPDSGDTKDGSDANVSMIPSRSLTSLARRYCVTDPCPVDISAPHEIGRALDELRCRLARLLQAHVCHEAEGIRGLVASGARRMKTFEQLVVLTG